MQISLSGMQENSYTMVCLPVLEIIHLLKLVDYLLVHADKPWHTVITLNIGTHRPATVVVLNIKQFNFTLK